MIAAGRLALACTVVLLAVADTAAAAGPNAFTPGGFGSTPYPGRPVPGRPVPTRPSPYNAAPGPAREYFAPSPVPRAEGGKQPSFYRDYSDTSLAGKNCHWMAKRARKSKTWRARYRACLEKGD